MISKEFLNKTPNTYLIFKIFQKSSVVPKTWFSNHIKMESEPFELTEQYPPIEFSHQDYGYPQDDYQYTHSNSRGFLFLSWNIND